jgi:glycosyltransferase involved in cell wall biosynthesis
MARELEAAGLAVDQVIANGTRPVPARGPLRNPPLAAYAGRLLEAKGLDDLLEAFPLVLERVPAAKLLIVGNGPYRDQLAGQVARSSLGERVQLHPYVPRPGLDELLADAWVQVLPSRFREPSANVLPEAMMRGTAVVATDTGGTPEVVRDGVTGFLYPVGQPTELAKKLSLLLGDRELAERMGRSGREVAKREYTAEHMVEQFEAAYQRILTR